MANLTLRLVKGSPLTNAEVDGNFSNLNSAKPENDGTGASGTWGISVSGSAASVVVTDDTASAGTHYVHIGDATTGGDGVKVSSTGLTFQPSTGNLVAGGTVTGTSDERLKTDWARVADNFIESLAQVKSGTYTRTDTGARQIGVGAQSLQPVAPEGVIDGEMLSVAYGNVALVAAIELAKAVVELKAEVQSLKAQLKG